MKDKLSATIGLLDGCLEAIESKYNSGVIDGFNAQSFPQFLPDDAVDVFRLWAQSKSHYVIQPPFYL